MKPKKETGFTLIELMVTVAIVGILAAIAYPSYLEQIRRTRRADAQGALLGLANAMERYFTENNRYTGAAGTTATPADTGAPRIYATQSPLDGTAKYYNLTISAAAAASFSLNAAPISTSAQNGDKCGTFTLTHTGARGISGGASGVTSADCWK
ncbi:MAG: type IV pilin protein [Gammaproteobacteria bacterium]